MTDGNEGRATEQDEGWARTIAIRISNSLSSQVRYRAALDLIAEIRAAARESALREAWVRIDYDDEMTLPDAGKRVDIAVRSNGLEHVAVGMWDVERELWTDVETDGQNDPLEWAYGEVTHWKPRPAPPPPPTKGTSDE